MTFSDAKWNLLQLLPLVQLIAQADIYIHINENTYIDAFFNKYTSIKEINQDSIKSGTYT